MDAASFVELIRENWDTMKAVILDASPSEREEGKAMILEEIPGAKPLLDILYDPAGDFDTLQNAIDDMNREAIKDIAFKIEETKIVQIVDEE